MRFYPFRQQANSYYFQIINNFFLILCALNIFQLKTEEYRKDFVSDSLDTKIIINRTIVIYIYILRFVKF